MNLQKPASASLCRKLGKYGENTRSSPQTCHYCPIKNWDKFCDKISQNPVYVTNSVDYMDSHYDLPSLWGRKLFQLLFSVWAANQPTGCLIHNLIFFKQKNKQTMIHRSVCMALMAYCPLLLEVSKLILIYSLVTLTVVWILGLSYFKQCQYFPCRLSDTSCPITAERVERKLTWLQSHRITMWTAVSADKLSIY